MPIAIINIVEGRDPERRRAMAKAVARTIAETLDAPLATVRVLVNELPADQWSVGDQLKSEIDAR